MSACLLRELSSFSTTRSIKTVMLSIQLLCVVLALVTSAVSGFDEDWIGYKDIHGKVYSGREDMMRRRVWQSNMVYINRHNLEADRGQHSYWMGENEYTDMTNQEFRALMNGYLMSNSSSPLSNVQFVASDDPMADTVDWRTKGYVTEIKNQGQCGSCWAFSATGSLEGQHFKKTGKLVSLSEQNLVDCSNLYGNHGCQGGMMDNAFKYIKANKGIDTERSYSYVERKWSWDIGATLSSFVDVEKTEKALAQAVSTNGPVSVAIDAGHDSFQHYRTGIYTEPDCSSTQLDHGVLVVGYGSDGGQNYWIVKNSWGTSWGEQGYFKMLKDSNNMCGEQPKPATLWSKVPIQMKCMKAGWGGGGR